MTVPFVQVCCGKMINIFLRSLRYSTALKRNGDLNLTESCVKRLKEICKNGSFLRITVDGGGCSGFQYNLKIDTAHGDNDIEIGSKDNVKVVIDDVSLEYVAGSTVDYHEELIRSGFRIINNPKASAGCSCGASFNVKLD